MNKSPVMDKMPDVEIRLSTKSDIPKIADLYVRSWKRTYQGLLSQSYLDNLNVKEAGKTWLSYIKAPRQGIFVM